MRATRAIIHLENLRHNLEIIRKKAGPRVKICLAVKADGYGHGAVPIAKEAEIAGVDFFGVATAEEGVELKNAGIEKSVLLLGVPLPEEVPLIVSQGIIPIVSSREFLDDLSKEAEKQKKMISVHIKIDTGMGRLGITPEAAVETALKIKKGNHLTLGGVCTHFSSSDSGNEEFTRYQLGLFIKTVESIRKSGMDPGIVHAANSGAIIGWPPSFFDMVRPGILAYGYYPSKDQDRNLGIKPVMELSTKIVFQKKVKKGTPISYGMTYKTREDTVIATIPVGYGDGYSRLLSNKAEVWIANRRYPVVGRVCMDQTMVDLGPDRDMPLYTDVTLFGPEKGCPDAEEIASIMGTIPYEVTCLITKRVPRTCVGGSIRR